MEEADHMTQPRGDAANPPVTQMIYVPFNAAGVPSGVAGMPHAIRAAGIEHRLPAPVQSSWIDADGMTPERGPSGLVSEDTLVRVISDTAETVGSAWRDDRIPVVVAGDCPILLAPLIAAAERRGAGLVFIDGHEDAWDPHGTPTGEASDCEVGLALGLFSGPAALAAYLPCLRPEHLVVLGPRDQAELADARQPSIRGRVPRYLSGAQLASRADTDSYTDVADLVAGGAASADAGWWCHIDLDVLDTASLPAVDYPQPGGLTWNQLERLTAACLSVPGCIGASVVI
jgi:arginase